MKNKYVGLPSKNVHEESKNLSTEDNHSKNASKKVRTKSYSCVECNETFKSLLSFKSHKKNHDKKVEESSSENETVNNADVELINRTNSRDASKVKLTCQVCNKTYLKASNLAAHMGLHTGIKPYQCSICGMYIL